MSDPIQVLWTALPAGTPRREGKVTALASLRFPVPAGETESFKHRLIWPSYVTGLQFSLEADTGQSVPLHGATVSKDALALWGDLFPDDAIVRSIDGTSMRALDGQPDPAPLAVAPPSAMAWQSVRDLYVRSVQGRVTGEGAVGVSALGNTRLDWSKRPRDWEGYVSGHMRAMENVSHGNIELAEAALPDRLAAVERFHLRPAARTHPAIESAPPRPINADAQCDVQEGDVVILPEADQVAPGGTRPFTAPEDVELFVVACGGDRIANGKCYRIPRGGRATFQRHGERTWVPIDAVVLVGAEDHRAEISFDPWKQTERGPQKFKVILPPTDSLGKFEVTFRNHGETALEVEGQESVPAGGIRTFRRHNRTWVSEDPNDAQDDVHGRLAALGRHPTLLRMLGLAVDFDVPPQTLPASGRLRICVEDSANNGVEHRSMWTHYQRVGDRLRAKPSERTTSHRFPDGLLRTNPIRYELMTVDVDAAAHQVLRSSATRKAVFDSEAGAARIRLDATLSAADAERELLNEEHLPALRQAGFALTDAFAAAETQDSVAQSRSLAAQLATEKCGVITGNEGLYAEDLLRGFRVDVKSGAEWRSLCRRSVSYIADGKPLTEFVEEGVIGPAADVGRDAGQQKPEVLRVSSAMFRWDGWSLAVERPGQELLDGGTGPREEGVREPAQLGRLAFVFEVPDGDLEPLRFGKSYQFRLRAVDLAGNSLTVEEAKPLTKAETIFGPAPFLRPEAVEPPMIVPRRARAWVGDETQLAIRSKYDWSSWWVVPAGVNPAFFEMHGRLDSLDADRAWDVLDRHQHAVPRSSKDPGYSRLNAVAGGLPHLPDPLCTGAVVQKAEGGLSKPLLQASFRMDRPKKVRPIAPWETRPLTFELRGGDRDSISTRSGFVKITLPAGVKREVKLGATIDDDLWRYLAVPVWVGEVGIKMTAESMRASASSGSLPEVAPTRIVTLVHAVPQPLLPAGRKAIEIVDALGHSVETTAHRCTRIDISTQPEESCVLKVDRKVDAAPAVITGHMALHVPSSAKIDMHASWTETLDLPNTDAWFEQPFEDHAFELNVPYPPEYLEFGGTGRRPSVPTGFDPGEPPDPERCTSGADGCSFSAQHKFADQKHRRVTYTAMVTSRYVDFFTDRPASVKEKVASAPTAVHIPASAAPAAPKPLYAVPAFAREERRTRKELERHQRGGALRIYLERGWFSSGEDEKLAVVLAHAKHQELPDWAEEVVTLWGQDPIWVSESLPQRPLISRFKAYSAVVERMIVKKPVSDVPMPPMENHPCPPPPRAVNLREEIVATIAAYDVHLDAEKNLLYADVEIDLGATASYFPFIRLALARYQPYALAGLHLSRIVRAHFVQLTPERTVTVRRDGSSQWSVTVAGLADARQTHGRNTIVEAVIERARYCGPERKQVVWERSGDAVVLERRVAESQGLVWVGTVRGDTALGIADRLLITEWEQWNQGNKRIIYAETVAL